MENVLHFAPERCLQWIPQHAKKYTTIDLAIPEVNVAADICKLPFADQTFDFIFCSHVLEHVRNAEMGIGELYRILKTGGAAILAVPLWPGESKSILYDQPRASEHDHWWRPGDDWFKKYEHAGFGVQVFDPLHFGKERFGLLPGWDRCALCTRQK